LAIALLEHVVKFFSKAKEEQKIIFDKTQNRPYNEPRNKNVDEKSKFSRNCPERLWLV